MAAVHVVGAGLAGLAAAVRLAERGGRVTLYEAAQQAGGRCRSFFDRTLGRVIDNGNHLLVKAQQSRSPTSRRSARRKALIGPAHALPFVDLTTGERWTIRPDRGPLPLWVMLPSPRAGRPRERLSRPGGCGAPTSGRPWPIACAPTRCCGGASGRRCDRGAQHAGQEGLGPAALGGAAGELPRGAAGCRPLIARASLAAEPDRSGARVLAPSRDQTRYGRRACAGSPWRIAAPAPRPGSAGSSWGRPIERSWRCRPAR